MSTINLDVLHEAIQKALQQEPATPTESQQPQQQPRAATAAPQQGQPRSDDGQFAAKPSRLDRIEAAIEKLAAQGQSAQQPAEQPAVAEPAPKPPAAAPRAPNALNQQYPTNGGVIDLFNLTPQQLQNFSPSDLRREFEKITNLDRELRGAPRRPEPAGAPRRGPSSPDRR